ncbi:helix-turn-helix domain-containing protein [Aureimonas pseudogalii]
MTIARRVGVSRATLYRRLNAKK